MRAYRGPGQPATSSYGPTQVSGVHQAPVEPALYADEAVTEPLVGSVPIDALTARFKPIVDLQTGATLAYEALPHCDAPGLGDTEELYARAAFEKKVGELGRAVRRIAFKACAGAPVFIGVHPHELKDSWLIRPDDPISGHDAEVFLQVDQPSYSAVCMHVLTEVSHRTGISIAVDDLGAGASTLKQVIDLGPAFIKLDPELVRGIDRNVRKRVVVAGLVAMCRELEAHLIAKGVDNVEELRALVKLGVAYGQGSLLGAASDIPEASPWQGLG